MKCECNGKIQQITRGKWGKVTCKHLHCEIVVHMHVCMCEYLTKLITMLFFRQLVAIFTFSLHLSSYLQDLFSSTVAHCRLLPRPRLSCDGIQ